MRFLKKWALVGAIAAVAVAQAAAAPVQFASNAPNITALAGVQTDTTSSGPFVATIPTGGGYTVTRVEWWGYDLDQQPATTNTFDVSLNGFALTGTFGSEATGIGPFLGIEVFKFFLDLSATPQVLTMGVSSTLGIQYTDFNVEWYWQGGIGSPNAGQAFALFGTRDPGQVSEPASATLAALALLLMFAARRSRA